MKIAVARALHDGLSARELYVGAKTLGEREVQVADQQDLSHVAGFFHPPPLFAEATIDIAQSLADKRVRSFLAQFRLKGLDERNQNLSLYLGLLYDGDVHASPPLAFRLSSSDQPASD
jgi:hypothetical protein